MKYVPLEKRSKKEQRAFYRARRGSWNGVVPVTKTVPNKKHDERKRAKRRWDPDALPVCFFTTVQPQVFSPYRSAPKA